MAVQSIPKDGFLLGIDLGDARVGLALAHSIARIPRPYAILDNDENLMDKITDIIDQERIQAVVVGLPRDNEGKETAQSQKSRDFLSELTKSTSVSLELADESLSSVRAEQSRYSGTSDKYLDDVAACYILEEFFGNING